MAQIPTDVELTEVPITALIPDAENARVHDARNLELIRQSMEEVGMMRSIAADESLTVLAGSGAVEAAQAAGIRRAIVIDTDGDALIVHRRRGLTDEQKRRYALLDNYAAEQATWNEAMLTEWATTRPEVIAHIFTDAEIAALLAPADALAFDIPNGDLPETGFADTTQFTESYQIIIELSAAQINDAALKTDLAAFAQRFGVRYKIKPR